MQDSPPAVTHPAADYTGSTREALVQQRVGQVLFRRSVLACTARTARSTFTSACRCFASPGSRG